MSIAYKKQRRFDLAELYALRVLELREKALGVNHMLVSQACNNLANIHNRLGNVDKAMSLYERAAAIIRELLGAKHPDYAQNRYNIGNLLLRAGRNAEAIPFYRLALTVSKENYGMEHILSFKISQKYAEAHSGIVTNDRILESFKHGKKIILFNYIH